MNRFRKYSFWTGLASAVVIVANLIAKACGFTINDKIIEEIIMSVCSLLVVLGVVSAPINSTNKEDVEEININEPMIDSDEPIADENKPKEDDIN